MRVLLASILCVVAVTPCLAAERHKGNTAMALALASFKDERKPVEPPKEVIQSSPKSEAPSLVKVEPEPVKTVVPATYTVTYPSPVMYYPQQRTYASPSWGQPVYGGGNFSGYGGGFSASCGSGG